MYSDQTSNIYSVTGMFTGSLTILPAVNEWLLLKLNRSWKNHIKSCKHDNQATIYQTLCILIDELDLIKFNKVLDQFINHWTNEEPSFIEYFKQYYKNRPEKWAKCYRCFPHADTDTNMYLER